MKASKQTPLKNSSLLQRQSSTPQPGTNPSRHNSLSPPLSSQDPYAMPFSLLPPQITTYFNPGSWSLRPFAIPTDP